MHRTSLIRSLALLLVVGSGLLLSLGTAASQEKTPVLILSVGESKRVEMSKKQPIMTAASERPKIVQIDPIKDVANAVFITGAGPGTVRVNLTDANKVTESIDVTVTSEKKQEFLDQVAKTYPGAKDINVVSTTKATTITGIAPDPRTIKAITELAKAIFPDAVVALNLPDNIRAEFEQLIAKAVPGARVNVYVSGGNVVVSGTAPTEAAIKTVAQASKNTFGDDVVISVQIAGEEYSNNVPRVQQVELEVIVAVVNRSELRRMSFNWAENRQNYFVSSLIGPTAGAGLGLLNAIATGIGGASQSAAGNPNLQFGVVGNRGSFLGFLEALRTEGLAKVYAEPRIVAMAGRRTQNAATNAATTNANVGTNNQNNVSTAGTATSNRPFILSGGETPVIVPSSPGSPPTVQYKPFGTRVEFEPVVLQNGQIQLDIAAELSSQNGGINLPGGGFVPAFDSRKAETTVMMEDGQTLAIGGLIQNKVIATSNKVPFLGDIPFLGAAFSSTSYDEREEEMIVLVTPRLVDSMNCTQLPRRLPGRETRSADDFELFLTQILEAPRGPREVFPGGRFHAAHRNSPTSGIYPCGDNSQSWGRGGCATGNCGAGCAKGQSAATQPVTSAVTASHVNLAPIEPLEAVPAAAPASFPPPLASIPIPEAPALPPLPSDTPETRPAVPASLGPVGSDR